MKLNELELDNYQSSDNKVTFVLTGEVLSDAVALDGQTLTVTDSEQQIAVFSGYEVVAVYLELGNTVVGCMRELDESTKEAITGLDSNVKILTEKVNGAEQNVKDFTEKVTNVEEKVTGVEDNVSTFTEKVTGVETKVTSVEKNVTKLESTVSDVADMANPDIVTFAKMAVPAMTIDMTTTEICSIASLLPEWKVGASYEQHQVFTYEGKVYRAAQKIPEAQEIYKPGQQGTESLYTLIELADDGVRIWKKPTDATNSFAFGERAHYPTASDPIYVSKRDGNDSEPTKDERWMLEDAEE